MVDALLYIFGVYAFWRLVKQTRYWDISDWGDAIGTFLVIVGTFVFLVWLLGNGPGSPLDGGRISPNDHPPTAAEQGVMDMWHKNRR